MERRNLFRLFFIHYTGNGASRRDARTCVFWEYLRLLGICTAIYYKKHTKTWTIIDTHGRASLGNRHKKGDVIARVSLIFWGIILILI